MSREVRRVPKDWKHPKDKNGNYIPLLYDYDEDLKSWMEYKEKYKKEEFSEEKPNPKDYMPNWPKEERTHLQMYETTSEGTPISPVMETPEELARWLADNKASVFADMTASYDDWFAMIKAGWAPSAVVGPNGMISGVEAVARMEKEKE